MKIHPLLRDPRAVLISYSPVTDPVCRDDYSTAARQVMAAMQIELEGEKAVVKPNLTSAEHFADPDTGITTHPAFIEAMAEYLGEHGVRPGGIYVLEDPRNSDDNDPRHWRGTGLCALAERGKVKLRCPKTYTCVKKEVPDPLAHPVLNVSRLAVSSNTVLFNVPKLKTHNLGTTTLGMKNLMGTVNVFDRHYCGQARKEIPESAQSKKRPRSEWMDREMHERLQDGLARRLADTSKVVPSHITMIEGIVGREGTGFQRGRNRPLGLVVAGTNIVAVDSVTSYLMGFDPLRLIYLRVAANAGLGLNNIDELQLYTVQDGDLAPCGDVEALRASPPFRVITGVRGEKPWDT